MRLILSRFDSSNKQQRALLRLCTKHGGNIEHARARMLWIFQREDEGPGS